MNQTSHTLNGLRCAVIGIMLFALACSGCTKRDANRASTPASGTSVSQPTRTPEHGNSISAGAGGTPNTLTDEVSSKPPEANSGQDSRRNAVSPGAKSATGRQAPDNARAAASASETNISDADSNSTTRVDDRRSNNNALDPRAAEARAERMIAEAERAGEKAKISQAFQLAVGAWETVRAHTTDARCKELAEKSLTLVEQFGEAANSNSAGVDRKRPVTVK